MKSSEFFVEELLLVEGPKILERFEKLYVEYRKNGCFNRKIQEVFYKGLANFLTLTSTIFLPSQIKEGKGYVKFVNYITENALDLNDAYNFY